MFQFSTIAIVFIFASCGKNSSEQGAAAGSCTSNKPGFLCLSGQQTPQLDGMCSQTSDCPPPYNFCDASNRCQVQAAQSGSNQIWFATDPIRPGINAGDDPGPSGTGYIYNIMAKGYESLDDWCMSQAQLSTIPQMRQVGSWTALITAQGNSSYTTDRLNAYIGYASGTLQGLPSVPTGSSNAPFYTRDGVGNGGLNLWSGIDRSFCQTMVEPLSNVCSTSYFSYNHECAPDACQCYSAESAYCSPNFWHTEGNIYINTIAPSAASIVLGSTANKNSNDWADPSGQVSLMIPIPADCFTEFDVVSNCDGGNFYNADATTARGVVCVSD